MASRYSLRVRMVVLSLAATITPILITLLISQWGNQRASHIGRSALEASADSELTRIVAAAEEQARLSADLLGQRASATLALVADRIAMAGGLALDPSARVSWTAINQLDGSRREVELPQLQLGSVWLGQQRDFGSSITVPIVDEVSRATDDTATIFQRLDDGSMLRVATSVRNKEGRRAIGTFIPASSPVVAAVTAGKSFVGRAFVVDRYYMSAYSPIRDAAGTLIGMLYVGTPEAQATQPVRARLLAQTVHESGHVYVLHAKGELAGTYALSPGGAEDGKNVLAMTDADGRAVVREIVETARTLAPGHYGRVRSSTIDPKTGLRRTEVTRIAYFEPWDWVICAESYEDEFLAGAKNFEAVLVRISWTQGAAAVAAALFAVVAFLWLSRSLNRSLDRIGATLIESSDRVAHSARGITESSNDLATNASSQAAALEESSASLEELSSMVRENAGHAQSAKAAANSARIATEKCAGEMAHMAEAMKGIESSSAEVARIARTIDEIAFQTNILALNAAVEAARAGEAGAGFAVVAEEVRALAKRSADSARESAARIEEATTRSRTGATLSAQVSHSLAEILQHARTVDSLVGQIAAAGSQQSSGIEQLNLAVAEMDRKTQSNAARSEETAAAATDLQGEAQALHASVEDLRVVLHGSRAARSAEGATHDAFSEQRSALSSQRSALSDQRSAPNARLALGPSVQHRDVTKTPA